MTLTRILNGFLVSEDGESAYFATAAEAAAVMERAIGAAEGIAGAAQGTAGKSGESLWSDDE